MSDSLFYIVNLTNRHNDHPEISSETIELYVQAFRSLKIVIMIDDSALLTEKLRSLRVNQNVVLADQSTVNVLLSHYFEDCL